LGLGQNRSVMQGHLALLIKITWYQYSVNAIHIH
jgi:hypothetical protein